MARWLSISKVYLGIIEFTKFMGDVMPAVKVRNISAETHRALKARAAQHGRSTEAEIRAILEAVVRSDGRIKVGSELAAFGRRFGGLDPAITRDKSPARHAMFE
jgi:plasmid stability protein